MKQLLKKLTVVAFATSIFALGGCGFDELLFNEGLWLKMDDKSVVHTSDIDFYDVSSHMIYLKHELSFLDKVNHGDLISMYVGNHKIYDCSFHSMYSSSLPTGAFIYTNPLFYPEDILSIGFIQILNENLEPTKTDPRNDERIIRALKKHGQYHEGLNCNLLSYTYSEGKLVFKISLSNPDTFDYYYLDPDKMGFGLFHYFTNGPTFWGVKEQKSYTHQGTITQPEPWNSWKKEWLSLIKSGEHKNITITYDQFEIMPAGQYRMNFAFPSLHYGITKQDRVLKDGRIWMGSSCIEEMVTI